MKKIRLLFFALLTVQTIFAQWTDQSSWSHRGPFKSGTGIYESGRLDVVVLHPSYNGTTNTTIYAGGSNGGLWKTPDGGLSWTNIPTNFMRYSGIGDMAFTSDGLYLYIADRISSGTGGDRGSGVYKYTLSSGAWAEAGTFQSNTLVTSLGLKVKNNHIKIHPLDNAYLYLATSAGLWVSTNGGSNWGTSPIVAGNFENIAFVPNTAATGQYDIYISGMNTIMKSSDKGATFSPIPTPSPNNPFTSYTSPYLDMAYGGIDADGTSKILYFQGWVSSPALYVIYKYKIPTSGSPTMTFLLQDNTWGPEIDRLCIAGNKDVVYYGGTRVIKYKISNSTVYDPVPVPNGTDVALSPGIFPSYYSGQSGTDPYLTMIHADQHDIKIFDNGTIHKIFVAHDGGFSEDTYSTTATAGVYSNSWTYRNNGLNIATIFGFSGSDTETDVYATGEQDTKGFVFNEAMTKVVAFGIEPRMVLLDRTKKKNISGQNMYRVFHNYNSWGVDYYADNVDFNVIPATRAQTSIGMYECDPTSSYFLPNNTVSEVHTPQTKVFYQDPARAQNIYAYSAGIWQWDEATQKFGPKYKIGKRLNDPDPLKADHPFQMANSMAISRRNKNKIYFASDANGIQYASQIYRYTGTNIDDSWDTHNDLTWDYITPDLKSTPFNYSLTNLELFNIKYKSIVMSDWDDNKLWVMVWGTDYLNVPNHPELKILKYDNGSWTNYSENIPLNEDPQSMVYEHGSNDGIYLTTDRNVYYRNSFMSQWEVFNSGTNQFPHTLSHQMEINYTENTCRVASWGRGIWKTNLNCLNAGIDPVIPTSCNNCNDATHYFWQGNTVSLANTTLTNNKQIVRGITSIDILPESTFDPLGNPNVYYEFFIHGCGPGQNNSFRIYQNPDISSNSEEEEDEEEREMAGNISAYPNPNNGSFTLNTGTIEEKDIYVYDVLGKIVFQKNKVTEKTIDINIPSSPKGIYMVKVISDDRTETIKIINQ
jgi:hypothetical protein